MYQNIKMIKEHMDGPGLEVERKGRHGQMETPYFASTPLGWHVKKRHGAMVVRKARGLGSRAAYSAVDI